MTKKPENKQTKQPQTNKTQPSNQPNKKKNPTKTNQPTNQSPPHNWTEPNTLSCKLEWISRSFQMHNKLIVFPKN